LELALKVLFLGAFESHQCDATSMLARVPIPQSYAGICVRGKIFHNGNIDKVVGVSGVDVLPVVGDLLSVFSFHTWIVVCCILCYGSLQAQP
jgi:hypothetical protein